MSAAARQGGFAHVRHWVFDLDNTLYSARYRLFDQIDERMGAWLAGFLGVGRAEARRVQKDYFHHYGTTLRGLMKHHGVQPKSFLDYVHDIDYSHIAPDPVLEAALGRLPGSKWIFTNGTKEHARAVMEQLGVSGHVDAVFDIADAGYLPKPFAETYAAFIAKSRIDPARAAMFEDIARNLKEPHQMGMTTVLVEHPDNIDGCCANARHGDSKAEYVHHVTDDLGQFLRALTSTEKNEEELHS